MTHTEEGQIIGPMRPLTISLLAGLLCASSALADVTNLVNFTAVVFVQNTSKDIGNVTVTSAPVQKRVSTKDILNYLAQDLNGYPFPSGARLALISSGPGSGHFAVVDGGMNVLMDASGIMTFSTVGSQVSSGRSDSAGTYLARQMQGLEVATISFDDTSISGGSDIQFSIQGMLSGAVSDSWGVESQSGTISNATGQGYYQGIPLVLKATVSIHGRGPVF